MGSRPLSPTMQRLARRHPSALAGLLGAASLALVFGTVLGVVPETALPRAPDGVLAAIPHANVAISLAAIVAISTGWRAIRRGEVDRHRRRMLVAAALFAAFLVLYLYRLTLEGPTSFAGPETVYRFLYLPMLAVHVTLAVVCVPLLYYVLLLAVTRPVSEIPLTRHPGVGRIAAALWLTSFALGIATYLQLYVLF